MRAIVFMTIACLLALQTVSSVGGEKMGDAEAAVSLADCNKESGEHPGNHKNHALDCCLACNHSAASKSFFPFLVAFARVVADLSPRVEEFFAYFPADENSQPPCGWATSWASRAPPTLS
ncbi:MAG: hypothetical protein AB7F41_12440 [Methylocystis sp.]|uniref:hypothetical protein n=1 Tax=Methylocystis sp. TaxID=1911079 RepID=UPI003D0E514E